jgi:DNA-binding transcriptional MocR family regulator
MTPAEEARFIALWTAGTETAAMAQALGIPRGTVGSRAYALQRQGKIQPRPKGGNYPMQRRQRRQEDTPTTPTSPVPKVVHAPPMTPAHPAMTFVAVPEIQEMLILMQDLHARVVSLEQTRVPPALPAHTTTTAPHTTPAPPAIERKDIQQWTVRLSKALVDHLKAVAYERRIPPSQLVEELVWTALTNQALSTPEPASTPHKTSSWNR